MTAKVYNRFNDVYGNECAFDNSPDFATFWFNLTHQVSKKYEDNSMTTKVYNRFNDVYGNEYAFDNYLDFATFWFNLTRQVSKKHFDSTTWKKLQYAAANSKEARTLLTR